MRTGVAVAGTSSKVNKGMDYNIFETAKSAVLIWMGLYTTVEIPSWEYLQCMTDESNYLLSQKWTASATCWLVQPRSLAALRWYKAALPATLRFPDLTTSQGIVRLYFLNASEHACLLAMSTIAPTISSLIKSNCWPP